MGGQLQRPVSWVLGGCVRAAHYVWIWYEFRQKQISFADGRFRCFWTETIAQQQHKTSTLVSQSSKR